MRCYYCARKIEDGDKPIVVGLGKEVHPQCLEAYREYLKEIAKTMNVQAKERAN